MFFNVAVFYKYIYNFAMVYKALHGLAPKYIRDMLTYKQSNNYSLRSDELGLLHVPSTRRKSFGDRAFLKASCHMAALHTGRQILIFSEKIIKFCLPIIHNMKLQRSGIIDNKFHT